MSEELDRTQRWYDEHADFYIEKHPEINFWEEERAKFQSFLPKGRILDVGCGQGRDAKFFSEQGYDVVGIDFSRVLLEYARKCAPKAKFLMMELPNVEFNNQSFDAFWAAASLLHLPKKDAMIALQEMRRILKPNGVGFVAVKEGVGEMMVGERFFAFYSQDELAKALNDAGFDVVEQGKRLADNKSVWLTFFVRCKPL